jgi:hypothetical protein
MSRGEACMFTKPNEAALRDLGVPDGVRIIAAGTAFAPGTAPRLQVVATSLGLYVTGWASPLRWDQIQTASWDEPVLDIVVEHDAGPRLVQLRLDRAGGLPDAIRDRVTASVVTTERRDLQGLGSATFIARKRSDDGTIRWAVMFDAGLDPTDPKLRAAADAQINELRAALGI